MDCVAPKCGFFYLAMRRLTGDTAKTNLFHGKTIAGTKNRAHIVHTAHIIEHHYTGSFSCALNSETEARLSSSNLSLRKLLL